VRVGASFHDVVELLCAAGDFFLSEEDAPVASATGRVVVVFVIMIS
jgi:hypothetical protein